MVISPSGLRIARIVSEYCAISTYITWFLPVFGWHELFIVLLFSIVRIGLRFEQEPINNYGSVSELLDTNFEGACGD